MWRLFVLFMMVMWPTLLVATDAPPRRLAPRDVVSLVVERNFGVASARLDADIAAEEIGTAKGKFDTELTLDGSQRIDRSRRSSTFFGTRTDTTLWSMGLSRELPTGTEVGASLANERERTFGAAAVNGVPVVPNIARYEPVLEFSLSQPLAQNVLGSVDRKAVTAARRAYEAADFGTQRRIQEIAFAALTNFWELSTARRSSTASQDAVNAARQFLARVQGKLTLGTAESTDVLAAKANVARREADAQEAKAEVLRAEETLRLALAWETTVPLEIDDREGGFEDDRSQVTSLVTQALSRRPDYLSAKQAVEERRLRLAMAKQKRWPEVDLVSSLALNEIDASYVDAVTGMNRPNWMVGMNLRLPLENRTARAEQRRADAEKAKALVRLKELELTVAGEVTRASHEVEARRKALAELRTAEQLEQERLRQELAKYETGRSSAATIIRTQDDAIAARKRAIDAHSRYAVSVAELLLTSGSLQNLR